MLIHTEQVPMYTTQAMLKTVNYNLVSRILTPPSREDSGILRPNYLLDYLFLVRSCSCYTRGQGPGTRE